MGRIIKLKESDLVHIINQIMNEQEVQKKPGLTPSKFSGPSSNTKPGNVDVRQRYGVDPAKAPSDYLGKGGRFEKEIGLTRKKEDQEFKIMVSKLPNLECLPNNKMRFFVLFVIGKKKELMRDMGVDERTLIYLTKIGIAIMGWQSTYATVDKLYDVDKVKGLNPWDVYKTIDKVLKTFVGSGVAARGTEWLAKKMGVDEPSFGPAEFMPSTFAKTGVEKKYGAGIDTVVGSGLGVMYNVLSKYKEAQKNGLSGQQSVNDIAKNKGIDGWVGNIGTGNHLWDVAIASHSYPEEKILVKYCTTNRPDFMAPCSKTTHEPFGSQNAWNNFKKHKWNQVYYSKNKNLDVFPGKLTVNQGQQIPNYLPYLTGAHGVVSGSSPHVMDNLLLIKRTNDRINEFKCIDEAFKKNLSLKR